MNYVQHAAQKLDTQDNKMFPINRQSLVTTACTKFCKM